MSADPAEIRRAVTLICEPGAVTQNNPTKQIDPATLLRLPQVLDLIPVCRSTWWAGVREGRFPGPVKLGKRVTCWRAAEVLALINSLPAQERPR